MNAAIDVRLSREIYDGICVVLERRQHSIAVANVSAHKVMTRLVDAVKVLEIARVSQRVKIDDFARRQLVKCDPHESRADKSRAAGHKYFLKLLGRNLIRSWFELVIRLAGILTRGFSRYRKLTLPFSEHR